MHRTKYFPLASLGTIGKVGKVGKVATTSRIGTLVTLVMPAALWLATGGCQHEAATGAVTDTHPPQAAAIEHAAEPQTAPPGEASSPPPAPESSRPASGASPTSAGRAGCGSDADCHAVDWYCESCQCLALATSTHAPKCTGPQVKCFVAPCRGQRAVCRSGRCQLQSDQAM